ncbi:hypothetical protein [Hansschlegelia plantiphila]|uniref:DUF3617 family protein n=1 Tax=Hansschlegelia plantiphila TaxID=374655 RepID=A0A9W6J2Z7_9HYPH|nr:hypothetical protein [Hansschlegelia plantiphila]GLK68434.1 hypothetical protein GCM10008179_20720 [Hansschlegelia plantiphila]
MTAVHSLATCAAVVSFLCLAGPTYADDPFSGTWAPSCSPRPSKEVDNKLATITFYGGALKFSGYECEIAGWKKERRRYSSDLTCFRKDEAAVKRRIAVRQIQAKLKVVVSDGAYGRTVERCSD